MLAVAIYLIPEVKHQKAAAMIPAMCRDLGGRLCLSSYDQQRRGWDLNLDT